MLSWVKKISLLLFIVLIAAVFYQFKNEPASAQTAPVCGTSPSDVVLVIDRSGSMKETIGTTGTKMSNAKSSARRFVDILATETKNRVGLSSFSTEGTIDRTLTNNYGSVKTEITNLTASGDTCTECGIFKGNRNITENGRTGIKKVIILLTDGKANVIQGSPNRVSTTTAENKAIAEAKNSHDTNGTVIFTIGVGNEINADFLKKIASITGGKYYASPTSDDLNSVYDKISQIIAKGAISGAVFNDVNSNGAIDSGESNLSGWNVLLVKPDQTTKTLATDANGAYSFGELCDGSYAVKQTVKSGWQQTLPAGNNYYTLSLSNGNSQINKNFGNSQIPPTSGPTCVENPETITVTPDNENGTGEPGEEVTYTVKVTNNNTNCADATFNLSASILNNTNGEWTYSFDQTSLTISSGANKSTKLHVTSPSNAVNGPKTITVNVQRSGEALKTFNTTYNVLVPAPPNTPTPEPITPTPTNTPGRTFMNLTLGIDGIGSTIRVPDGFKNPIHLNRNLTVKLFNTSDNSLFQTYSDQTFTYNPTLEKFETHLEVPLETGTIGNYNLYVQGPRFLYSQYPGSISVTGGQTKNLSSNNFLVITGNINNSDLSENRIDLMDYNVLIACSIYSQDRSLCDENPNNQDHSDLDDDGIVNEDDYTLFLREFSSQQGIILPE